MLFLQSPGGRWIERRYVMDNQLEQAFSKMGARVRINRLPVGLSPGAGIRVDILRDSQGEYFHVDRLWNVTLAVADVAPLDRHLVLVAQRDNHEQRFSTFLCGHDERSWFVAAIPESAAVQNVQDAK